MNPVLPSGMAFPGSWALHAFQTFIPLCSSPCGLAPLPTPVNPRVGRWPTGCFHIWLLGTLLRERPCAGSGGTCFHFSRAHAHLGADWTRRAVTLRSTAAAASPRPGESLPASPRPQLAALSPGHPGGCEAAGFGLHLSKCLSAVGTFPLEKSPPSPLRRRAGLQTGTEEKAGGGRAGAGALRGRFRECWAVACCVRRFRFWVWAQGRPCAPSIAPGHSHRDPGPGRPRLTWWAWSLGATVTVSRAPHARGARCPVPAGCGGVPTLAVDLVPALSQDSP